MRTLETKNLIDTLSRPISFKSEIDGARKLSQYRTGVALAQENRHEEALEEFEVALENQPKAGLTTTWD